MLKNNFVKFLLYTILIILYIPIINQVASFQINNHNINEDTIQDNQNSGADVNLNFKDIVEVSVKRNRWYGTIDEFHTKDSLISKIKLFKFINLPLIIFKTNYIYFHITILIIYASLLTLLLYKTVTSSPH